MMVKHHKSFLYRQSTEKYRELINHSANGVGEMIKKIIDVLQIIATSLFSVLFGLFLTPVLVWMYFRLFSPIPEKLSVFFIVIVFLALLLTALIILLFIRKKYLWAIAVLGTAAILYILGIPLFIIENNNELWLEKVFRKPGPAYFVEYSPAVMDLLKDVIALRIRVWDAIYWFAYPYLVIFPGAHFYFWKYRPAQKEEKKKPLWTTPQR